MEIAISDRQITVDSRDLLDYQEELALARAGDDEIQVAQIREEYKIRRETLELGPVYEFKLAPMGFLEQWQALDWARKHGLAGWQEDNLSPFLLALIMLLYRIKTWSGFTVAGNSGAPLECTEANKVLVFGQALPVIQALQWKEAREEVQDQKNSGTSQFG
ncbi:MAG: hypothetical protein A2Y80_02170 [Deltaproteobacteria bacterium RBG_13_58_19]|nr:MAG: hypothetical protein A2Y80_02170 [Deltaproteobacteria bacterium RBG_13_58_19]